MRPLILKVRLGDVLYGTRHLRHYLRAISVLDQLINLSKHNRTDAQRYGGKPLYAPRKDDQFITAVNANGRFAVWGPNGSVVLLFINPTATPQEVSKRLKVPGPNLGGPLSLPPDKRTGVPRMDATVFSKWFVRTPLRRLDTAEWPPYALGLRLCFHHNLIAWGDRVRSDGAGLQYRVVDSWLSPFSTAPANKSWVPKTLDEQEAYVQHAAVRGVLRSKAFDDKITSGIRLDGVGPSLDLLPMIRKEITRQYEICAEKGTIKRLKGGTTVDENLPEASVLEVLGDQSH